MVSAVEIESADFDADVNQEVLDCLNPDAPCSFFLYAGAGSGKTYTLVWALEEFRKLHGSRFLKEGKKIAVITYTKAARDEIIERVDADPLFEISTIHSFCWERIKMLHEDIRTWYLNSVPAEIDALKEEERRGRSGTKASIARLNKIENKTKRLEWLSKPRKFRYDPDTDNIEKNALNHSDVMKIASEFLTSKPSLHKILKNTFPFILIDESQDTDKNLVDALFSLEQATHPEIAIGFIGDTMQRIYGQGKSDLGVNLPERWKRPTKQLNRRSARRITALANDIRLEDDKRIQYAIEGQNLGNVRLFICENTCVDKTKIEADIRSRMANETKDEKWLLPDNVKSLALEHKMASNRLEFSRVFDPLYSNSKTKTGILDGTLPALRFFTESILPMANFVEAGDRYALMNLLKAKKSSLLYKQIGNDVTNPMKKLKNAVEEMAKFIANPSDVTLQDILEKNSKLKLFPVPESLRPFSKISKKLILDDFDIDLNFEESENNSENSSSTIDAISDFLEAPFDQISKYERYISEKAEFDTHQGVKGLEFDRVFVIMDDAEAGGFLFSYEKLLGVKELSTTDRKNLAEQKDSSLDRTRRLFYVICTRAKESLALLAYTQDRDKLKASVLSKGWFKEDEIITI